MQLTSIQLSTEGTGPRVDNVAIERGGTTFFRQVTVLGGPSTSLAGIDIVEPGTVAPASDVFALPARLSAGASSYSIGAVIGGATFEVSVVGGTSTKPLGLVYPGTTWPSQIVSAGSSINIGVVAAGSSTHVVGQVFAGSTWPVQVISGGSSVSFGMVGTSTLDVRVIGAGSSSLIGSVLSATAVGGAAIDPRQVTLVAATSGAAVTLAAQSTSILVGTVAQSSIGGVRDYLDSTGNYTQKFFYTTGLVAPTASTVQSINQVTNFTSGSSGTSFNVAAGRIFRIEYINISLRCTSGALLYADFAIRCTSSTAGTTGTTPPVFYQRLTATPPTTAANAGGAYMSITDLTIDLPSSASYGVTIVSNSSASNECVMSFGGAEYLV